MQSEYQQPSAPIRTALRRGSLYGAIMLIIYIVIQQMTHYTFPNSYLASLNVPVAVINYGVAGVLALLSVIVFLLCGISASRATGYASTGWIAAHFGSLIYGFGSFLAFCFVYFMFTLPYEGLTTSNQPDLVQSIVLPTLNFQLVTVFLFGAILMGNLGGSIGGLIGRGRATTMTRFT